MNTSSIFNCPNGRVEKAQIMFIFQSLILGLEITLHSEEEAGKLRPVFSLRRGGGERPRA